MAILAIRLRYHQSGRNSVNNRSVQLTTIRFTASTNTTLVLEKMMAAGKCPRCLCSSFTTQDLNLAGGKFTLLVCTSCNSIVGLSPEANLAHISFEVDLIKATVENTRQMVAEMYLHQQR